MKIMREKLKTICDCEGKFQQKIWAKFVKKLPRYTSLKNVVLHELYRGKSEMTNTYFQLYYGIFKLLSFVQLN
jgi:hypothetical protein